VQIAAPVLYVVLLVGAWSSTRVPGARAPLVTPRRPWAVVAAATLVAVPSVLQLTLAPGLLDALGRRPGELGDGQVWRLATSLLVQDGGWAGLVYNLAALVYVGLAAERVLGPARWWAVWLVGGVGAQFWGLVVQPTGAGNSVGTFGLTGALAVLALLRGGAAARLLGVVGLLAGVVLLVGGDVHGGAVVLGALAGAVLHLLTHRRAAGGPRRVALGEAPADGHDGDGGHRRPPRSEENP
jgi:membrane associated rhomboid family serine protease